MDRGDLFGVWRERPAGIQAEGLRARLQFILMSYAGLGGIVAVGLMVALASTPDRERVFVAARQAIESPAGQIELAIGSGVSVARDVLAPDRGQEGPPLAGAALAATPPRALTATPRPAADPRPAPARLGAELWPEPPALAALPSGPIAIGPGFARPVLPRTAAPSAQPTASAPARAPELAAPPGLQRLAGSAVQRLGDAQAAGWSGAAHRSIDPAPSGPSAPERPLPRSPAPAPPEPARSPVPAAAPPAGAGPASQPSPSAAAPVSSPTVPTAQPSPARPVATPAAPAPPASAPTVAIPAQPTAPTATPPRASAAVPTASTPRDGAGRGKHAGPREQERHERTERHDERTTERHEPQHQAPVAPDRSAAPAAPPSTEPAPAKPAPPAARPLVAHPAAPARAAASESRPTAPAPARRQDPPKGRK
ncbi:MAG TPA: hypothetical protein VGL23_10595 [Chloroflexota bacterium]